MALTGNSSALILPYDVLEPAAIAAKLVKTPDSMMHKGAH